MCSPRFVALLLNVDIFNLTSPVALFVNVLLKVSSLLPDEVRCIHLFNYTTMGVKILIVDKFLSDNLINSATYYVNYGITLVD